MITLNFFLLNSENIALSLSTIWDSDAKMGKGNKAGQRISHPKDILFQNTVTSVRPKHIALGVRLSLMECPINFKLDMVFPVPVTVATPELLTERLYVNSNYDDLLLF